MQPAVPRKGVRGIALLGVPVRVGRLWLVLTCVITGITLESLAPDRDGGALLLWYALALLVVMGIAACVAVHDLAHILAARRCNAPLRAVEPALLGNLSDAALPPTSPREEALVIAAGPAASAIVAAVLFAAGWALNAGSETLAAGLTLLAFANAIILLLSLVPGFPYDGGRVLRAFIWYLTDDIVVGTRVAAFYGQFLAFFAFVLALAALAAGERYAVWGAWGMLFLWAMHRASHDGMERVVWTENARATSAGDIVLGATTRIDAGATIDAAIDEALNAVNHGPILVTEGGAVCGVFSLERIRRVPRALWTERHVRDVAAPIDGIPRISADESAIALVDLFDATGSDLILVESPTDSRILGAVDRETTLRHLRERLAADRRRRRFGA